MQGNSDQGYVTLWRPRSELERTIDRRSSDYKQAGAHAEDFDRFAGSEEADRIRRAFGVLNA